MLTKEGGEYIVKSKIMVVSRMNACLVHRPRKEPCSAGGPTMAADGPRIPLAPAMNGKVNKAIRDVLVSLSVPDSPSQSQRGRVDNDVVDRPSTSSTRPRSVDCGLSKRWQGDLRSLLPPNILFWGILLCQCPINPDVVPHSPHCYSLLALSLGSCS